MRRRRTSVLILHHLHLLELEELHLLLPKHLLLLRSEHGHLGGWHVERHLRRNAHHHGGTRGEQMLSLLWCRLVLVPRVARHLVGKFGLVAAEELVEVGTRLWAPRGAAKTPSIQFASKAGEFAGLEVLRKDIGREGFFLVNDETLAMRQPRNNVGVLIV